jgi:hypothetical protein
VRDLQFLWDNAHPQSAAIIGIRVFAPGETRGTISASPEEQHEDE